MFFMCFDKHCHVQIRVIYEGEFVAKCLKAYVVWSIKNLKAYGHGTRSRAHTHSHTHSHTQRTRTRTQTRVHAGDEEWFTELENLPDSGLTPQEQVDNIIRAFEICRVRSVRLPVPSSGLAFM